ncbi:hypothetical protein TKK_0017120 [Trichogramma kaykai]|uniref:Uncharacterized protein n=1 Tax=Trichogramma kaykai TaxID=54128 RepID=A0ABD2W592_9HYME
MCRRRTIPEVTRPDEVFPLVDFPDRDSIDSEERESADFALDRESIDSDERVIANFTLSEPVAFDSDGEPIYEDSLYSEEASDDDSVITMFHWTIDVLHIDELFAMKSIDLHDGRVRVEFYYQEVRVTINNELIATLDRTMLCHKECEDDDIPACTWCNESQKAKGSRIFAKFDYMHEEQKYYKRKYYYFDE